VTDADLLHLIGLSPDDFQQVRQASTFEQAENSLVLLKERARKGYRRQVFELHPDRNDGDETKAALLRGLNVVMEKLEKLQVQRPAPPPRWVPMWNNTSTSSTTTYGSASVSFYVNGVRIS
jgi:hypothetical protein